MTPRGLALWVLIVVSLVVALGLGEPVRFLSQLGSTPAAHP